jgi:hypothetical protein
MDRYNKRIVMGVLMTLLVPAYLAMTRSRLGLKMLWPNIASSQPSRF